MTDPWGKLSRGSWMLGLLTALGCRPAPESAHVREAPPALPAMTASAKESRALAPPAPPPPAPALTASATAPGEAANNGTRPPALADKAIASWTDARALVALAADPKLKVKSPDTDEPDPLACDLPFEQSCVYDPCFSRGQECKVTCSKTCASCDDGCADRCGACQKSCTDDACRRSCAATCGECKQSCLKSRDKCATARCAQSELACNRETKRAWAAAGCVGKCPDINACIERCQFEKVCMDKCQKRFKGCDIEFCMMGSPPEGP